MLELASAAFGEEPARRLLVMRPGRERSVVEHSIGKRWSVAGPFMIADLGGLDVFRAVCANVFPSLSNTPDVPETLDRMVNQGRLGAKSGDGFYRDPSEWTAAADRINVQFRR